MNKILKFPQDFLWGTATSAYQVEGGINCDWIRYFDAGKACDHYHRYEEDFDLMKKLNLNAYRFSLEWSRIEPKEGSFDQREIEHYRKFLLALKKRNIKTMVTLHHFTNPVWLAEMGGWANKKVVFYFSRFAKKVFQEYKDIVDFWITINEPLIYASLGFGQGRWPPKQKDLFFLLKNLREEIFQKGRLPLKKINIGSVLRVIRNQILAHNKVYEILHQDKKERVMAGFAKNNQFFEPFSTRFWDRFSAGVSNYVWNHFFLNRVKNHLDFIGLNYYFHNKIKFPFQIRNENKVVSDLGWEIYPEGIYYVLRDLKKYNLPIYITENGLADKEDKLRKDFIKEHLSWTYQAIKEGVDVKGYFHWSLMDNFEWDLGFAPRFGLLEMDYKTKERKIRPSALYFAKIAKNNSLL